MRGVPSETGVRALANDFRWRYNSRKLKFGHVRAHGACVWVRGRKFQAQVIEGVRDLIVTVVEEREETRDDILDLHSVLVRGFVDSHHTNRS